MLRAIASANFWTGRGMVPAFVTPAADYRGVGHERVGGYRRNEISRVDEAAPSVEMTSTKRKLPNGHWGACQQQTTHFVRENQWGPNAGHNHHQAINKKVGKVLSATGVTAKRSRVITVQCSTDH